MRAFFLSVCNKTARFQGISTPENVKTRWSTVAVSTMMSNDSTVGFELCS